jgi:hypothetical protein
VLYTNETHRSTYLGYPVSDFQLFRVVTLIAFKFVVAVGGSLIFGWTIQFLQELGLVKFLKLAC